MKCKLPKLLSIIAFFFTRNTFAAAATTPVFQKLKSESSTLFVCHFDFQSSRTQEKFAGQIKLTSIGEVFLAVKRNDDPTNECSYALRDLNLGSETEDGAFHINALRNKACEPLLSHEMRKRLDEKLDVNLPQSEQDPKIKQPAAKVALIYVEGMRPCTVTTFVQRDLRTLQNRLTTTETHFHRPAILPEPLDTADALSAVKGISPRSREKQ